MHAVTAATRGAAQSPPNLSVRQRLQDVSEQVRAAEATTGNPPQPLARCVSQLHKDPTICAIMALATISVFSRKRRSWWARPSFRTISNWVTLPKADLNQRSSFLFFCSHCFSWPLNPVVLKTSALTPRFISAVFIRLCVCICNNSPPWYAEMSKRSRPFVWSKMHQSIVPAKSVRTTAATAMRHKLCFHYT